MWATDTLGAQECHYVHPPSLRPTILPNLLATRGCAFVGLSFVTSKWGAGVEAGTDLPEFAVTAEIDSITGCA